jgi:hypothetical protein
MSAGAAGRWEQLVTSAQLAVSRLRVKSALNPMLWLCGIVSVTCFVLAYLVIGTHPLLATFFMCVGAAPVLATILGFFYFMIWDPDKLQSEDYQIRREALDIIRQKGSSIPVSPSSLNLIANPVHDALIHRGDE